MPQIAEQVASRTGELAAIATALCWTGSSFAFAVASRRATGMATNQLRLWAALPPLAVLCLVATGRLWPVHVSDERALLLAASGVIGLVLGDVGYFHALATIGPRVASVLMAAWPAMAVLLGLFAGERVTLAIAGGLALTTAGVVLVLLRGGAGSAWNPSLTARQRLTGVLGALLGAFGQAAGALLSRVAMRPDADLPQGVDPLEGTLVRVAAAAVCLQLVIVVRRERGAFRKVLADPLALRAALAGTLFGPVAGIWLSMLALRTASNLGVAAALMATTPLFMMPVARLAYGARVGLLGLLGTVLAVGGAAVLLVPD